MVQDEAVKNVSFQSDRTRRKILLSYWIVVLLAIPLWWSTTSIARLRLPEERVNNLHSRKLKFPLRATLEGDFSELVARDIEEALRRRVHESRLDGTFSVDICSSRHKGEGAYEVSLNADAKETHVEGRKLILGAKSLSSEDIRDVISNSLTSLWLEGFGPDQQIVQFSPRYRLAFSLMNEDTAAGGSPLGWDVQTMINREITPVLQRLSILHNFTIESQVQFFAPLAFEPVKLEDGSFGLTEEQLSVFVNSAEWTLSSSVSDDPVLHFVIFVPSVNRRPLRILDGDSLPTKSSAFVIPQWGSIFIYNPSQSIESDLTLSALRPAFTVFRKQLLTLLGVPPLPSGVKTSEALSDWALDALLRRRAYENAEGSKDTLSSIVSLVHQIEGMPVDKDVTEDVRESLDALDKMYNVVRESPQLALQYSARAFSRASRAFFNPGMLALLYFPPEHNLAVYTPLLAPVAVPLVAAVLREVARWRKSRRQ
ncbi:GPI17 [Sanghuangporus vaninii]